MSPTLANGKVCYIEIPAVDIKRSADFYAKVFGWQIRKRGDGQTAFDDATGEVSGSWVVGRKTWSEPGLLLTIGVDAPEVTARFRDPGGNVIGLYQEPSRPAPGASD